MLELIVRSIYDKDKKRLISLLKNNRSMVSKKIPDTCLNWSLLHLASSLGFDDILNILLDYGAPIDQIDSYGWQASHIATLNGHFSSLKILLFAGASLHALTNSRENLVVVAVKAAQAEILRYLLAGGADSSTVTTYYMTPMDLAKSYSPACYAILSEHLQHNKNLNPLFSLDKESSPDLIKIAVFQGGGVKGIGFYGALRRLTEKKFLSLKELRIVAGTSAGAISAMLLAVGYDIEELGAILKNINFYGLLEPELKDSFFKIRKILLERGGLEKFLGNYIYELYCKVKSGQLNKEEDIFPIIASYVTRQLPLGATHKLFQMLGIHGDEFSKFETEFKKLKSEIDPFINRLLTYRGLFSGEIFRKQFVEWIKEKRLDENLTFQMLHDHAKSDAKYKDLYVAVYNANLKKTEIFSYETTPDAIIADAVRCSMSIQLFFEPHYHYINQKGVRCKEKSKHIYFDGGSLNNYILDHFDKKRYIGGNTTLQNGDHKQTNLQAIGFRLLDSELYAHYEEKKELSISSDAGIFNFLSAIFNSVLSFTVQESNFALKSDEFERTIHIDTLDIDTLDFDMSEENKQRLIQSSYNGVDKFIKRYKYHNTLPHTDSVQRAPSLNQYQGVLFPSCSTRNLATTLDQSNDGKFHDSIIKKT